MLVAARPASPRSGLSLLEVLAALAIFLISFIAIGGLINLASDRALDVQNQSLAVQMCQSKLNEVVCGAVALQSASGTVDEDSDWNWSVEAAPMDNINGLWNVTVRVSRQGSGGYETSATLSAMVLDPSVRGNASDKPQSSSSSSSGSTTGTTP